MHRSEAENQAPCAVCGVETASALERGFDVDSETVLCYACACERGGRWDEERATWSSEPDVVSLVPLIDPRER